MDRDDWNRDMVIHNLNSMPLPLVLPSSLVPAPVDWNTTVFEPAKFPDYMLHAGDPVALTKYLSAWKGFSSTTFDTPQMVFQFLLLAVCQYIVNIWLVMFEPYIIRWCLHHYHPSCMSGAVMLTMMTCYVSCSCYEFIQISAELVELFQPGSKCWNDQSTDRLT